MSDLSDLIQNVYDYFQKNFGDNADGLAAGSIFLAFEKLGAVISPNDFKLNPQDANFNPAITEQYESDLVNFVPHLTPEGFIQPRGDLSPRVDGQYSLVLGGANYLGSAPDDSAVALFLQLKGQAQTRLENSKANMDMTDFYPANLAPRFWFNDQDATLWTDACFESGSPAPSSGGAQPPLPSTPRVIPMDWQWRVVTADAAPTWSAASRLNVLSTADVIKNAGAISPALISASVVSTPPAPAASETSEAVAIQPKIAHSLNFTSMRQSSTSAEIVQPQREIFASSAHSAASEVFKTLQPDNAAAEVDTGPDPSELHVPGKVNWVRQMNPIYLKNVALGNLVSTLPAQDVSSNGFSLSFQYAVVQVERPWLAPEFLSAPNWYLPGYQKGQLATGAFKDDNEQFAFLPVKFIIVKDLIITAHWTDQDRNNAQNSASFGPFSLPGKTFTNETLSWKGMQIIGWFCQIMPVLPPGSDPASAALGAG